MESEDVAVNAALEVDGMVLDGSKLTVSFQTVLHTMRAKLDNIGKSTSNSTVESSRSTQTPTRQLYIGNIPPDTTSESIVQHFQRFGHIVSVKNYADRGFAFVIYQSVSDAKRAKMSIDEQPCMFGSRLAAIRYGRDPDARESRPMPKQSQSHSPQQLANSQQQQQQPQQSSYLPLPHPYAIGAAHLPPYAPSALMLSASSLLQPPPSQSTSPQQHPLQSHPITKQYLIPSSAPATSAAIGFPALIQSPQLYQMSFPYQLHPQMQFIAPALPMAYQQLQYPSAAQPQTTSRPQPHQQHQQQLQQPAQQPQFIMLPSPTPLSQFRHMQPQPPQ